MSDSLQQNDEYITSDDMVEMMQIFDGVGDVQESKVGVKGLYYQAIEVPKANLRAKLNSYTIKRGKKEEPQRFPLLHRVERKHPAKCGWNKLVKEKETGIFCIGLKRNHSFAILLKCLWWA